MRECQRNNSYYQYVLISVKANITATPELLVKHMSGSGKYFKFGTVAGLCLPKNCPNQYIEIRLRPIIERIAV